MNKNVINKEYYIKKDNKIVKCTSEEYLNFLKEMKKNGLKNLCPNCSVCTCDKIRYSNIKMSSEVNVGSCMTKTYSSVQDQKNKITSEKFFDVFECTKFKKYKDLVIREQQQINKQILILDKQILELKYFSKLSEQKVDEKLKALREAKEEKMKLLTENEIIERLEKQEVELKEEYSKKLRLINEEQ